MPITFKGTFIFQSTEHGWTESFYWQNASSGDPNNPRAWFTNAKFQNLRNARNGLCAAPASIKAIRISVDSDALGNPVLGDSYLDYTPNLPTTSYLSTSAEYSVALQAIWRDLPSRFRKFVFLRGIPDLLESAGGVFTPGNEPNWQPSFDKWTAAILALGAGWKSTQPVVLGNPNNFPVGYIPVTGYVYQGVSPQSVTITVPAGTFDLTTIGKKALVNIRGVNAGTKSLLNGRQIVRIASAQTLTLVIPRALSPFLTNGELIFLQPSLVQAASVDGQRITSRKAGAPLLVSRGRVRARARG